MAYHGSIPWRDARQVSIRHLPKQKGAILLDVSTDLAEYFAGQNERFKREQFLASCGIEMVP